MASGTKLLDGIQGKLVHRDFIYWNLLGTAEHIFAVIDWDDAVSGDPADDFGILACFHEQDFLDTALNSYRDYHEIDDAFTMRLQLHLLRNMLWKAVIRHRLGYFEQNENFFLNKNELGMPMKEYTIYKIKKALRQLEALL